ncbi:hypothetical protein [Mycolicibacterium sp. CR10]|uniref:hypothetical protein n=1 Tax=Mycolicibacterium sp. CR10 TaxID=2562314 RepID=UPI001F0FC93B|nr:hypothetical protein [Mycolicibacterium sp. CR10]
MPGPTMTREDSRRRAERAHRLRALGRTWQEVADAEGYRSRGAAKTAVERLHAAEPGETADEVRRYASDTLRIVRSILVGRFADASTSGDDQTLVSISRELHRNLDQWSKLVGAYAPTTQDVNVRVEQTPAAIIAETERRLLALAAERQPSLPGNIIEGEVIA